MHWRHRLEAHIKDEKEAQTARNRMIMFNGKDRDIVMLTGAGAATSGTKTMFTSQKSTRLWSMDDENLQIRRQHLASTWGFQCLELLRVSTTLGWFNVIELQKAFIKLWSFWRGITSTSTTRINKFDVSMLPWHEVPNAESFSEFLLHSDGLMS